MKNGKEKADKKWENSTENQKAGKKLKISTAGFAQEKLGQRMQCFWPTKENTAQNSVSKLLVEEEPVLG